MLNNERLRKGKIITFAGKEHQDVKGKLMPIRIIQIELIQHWHEEADGMNF